MKGVDILIHEVVSNEYIPTFILIDIDPPSTHTIATGMLHNV